MNNWKRLALPLGLGLVAAVMNWSIVAAKIKPESFVAVARDYAQGQPLKESDLVEVQISGPLEALRQAAVPWEHRATLFDRRVPRALLRGDLVLSRDATVLLDAPPIEDSFFVPVPSYAVTKFIRVGQEIEFYVSKCDENEVDGAIPVRAEGPQREPSVPSYEPVGPFRVLAVGGDSSPGVDAAEARHKGNEKALTLALRRSTVTHKPDAQTLRLWSLLEKGGSRRIVQVVLLKDHEAATAKKTQGHVNDSSKAPRSANPSPSGRPAGKTP
jgi:hypothetical protein